MNFLQKNLPDVTEAEVIRLITDEIAEGKTLDYKQALPSDQTEAKKEFLADVSSFANTLGGHIVFGVAEEKGIARKLSGISQADLDAVILRLENSIRDGIEPRVPWIRTHAVKLAAGGAIIILEIGRSWAGPHMVTYKGSSRFFARNSAGKYQLDVQEIRAAFLGTVSAAERFRAFRTDRIAKVLSDDLGFGLVGPTATVLHVAPMSAFSIGATASLDQMRRSGAEKTFRPIYSGGWSDRVTFDGYMRYSETNRDPARMKSCVQVFRNGCIEAIDAVMLTAQGDPPRQGVPTGIYEHKIAEALGGYLNYAIGIGLEPPFFAALTMVEVEGYILFINGYWGDSMRPIDREHLFFPEILIEDPAQTPTQILKPTFDALWNACGFDRSLNYNDAGEWAPRHR